MDDDVGAPFERPAEIGRGQRVVDDQRDARFVRDVGDRLEVDDDAAGIGEALDEDRLGLRRQRRLRKFAGSSGSTKITSQPNFVKVWPNWVSEPP